MRKALFTAFSLIVLLTACAGPPAPSAEKQAAAPTPLLAVTKAAPLPPTGCAEMPLGQAMIGNLWNPTTRRYELSPLNPETGQALCGYEPFETSGGFLHTFSPDRSRLALIELNEQPTEPGQVQLIQIDAWEATTAPLPPGIWVSRIAFDPTGARLALLQVHDRTIYGARVPTYTLNVLDTHTLETVAQGEVEIDARLLAWSEDGSELMVFGGVPVEAGASAGALAEAEAAAAVQFPTGRVVVFDPNTLERRWEQSLPGVRAGAANQQQEADGPYMFELMEPGVALSFDRQRLYIVHADEDRLTTVDFASRQVTWVPIQKQSAWDWSWLLGTVAQAKMANGTEKFAWLTPDGQRLFITGATNRTEQNENGDWQYERIPLGLKVVDPATGAELDHMDSEAVFGMGGIGMQPPIDATGAYLYLMEYPPNGSERTVVVDTEQLKEVHRLVGESLAPTQRLDGSPILLSVRYTEQEIQIRVFDPGTWKPLHTWKLSNPSHQGYPLLY